MLSVEQIGQLALLRAMVDPNAREQLSGMIDQVLDAQQKAETAISALRQQEATNRAILEGAAQKEAAARDIALHAKARSDELDTREAAMGEVQAELNKEKAAFEAVRKQVEADLSVRTSNLALREASLGERAREVAKQAADNAARSDKITAGELRLSAAVAALKAAMAELDE